MLIAIKVITPLDVIFICCLGSVFVWILRTVLYPPVETNSGHSLTSKMDLIAKTDNKFKLMLITLSAKSSIVDVGKGSEYASEMFWCRQLKIFTSHV